MKTISIFNLKGGTAKTTTAKNMAHILATTYHKRVLLIDLDSSGNLSASFELRPPRGSAFGLSTLVTDKTSQPNDFIQPTPVEGLFLLPANDTLKPAETEIRLDSRTPQQFRLMAQLRKIQEDYDYCIIDCPPSEDVLVINALACSQEVIIPARVNQDALDAVLRVGQLVSEIQDYNPALSIRGVLITSTMNNSVDKEGIEMDLGSYPKFNTYIRHSIEVERSRFMNLSLREYALAAGRKSFGPLLDYDNFVAEYLGLPPVHPDTPYCRKK